MKKSLFTLNMLLIIGLAPVSAQILNVSKITQKQDNWCWAGVSACVLEFYGNPQQQCVIAEYTRTHEQFSDLNFGTSDCCLSPSTCNSPNNLYMGSGSIEDILLHFANLANSTRDTSITQAVATTLFSQNRPFIIRWGWTAGGGHFIVGHGVSGENLYYMNPWPGEGKKIAKYSWVVSSSDHSWTHTLQISTPAQLPANAGTIAGPATVCQGQMAVLYRVPKIDRALTYIWTLPDSTVIENAPDSLWVNFGADAISGEISVVGKNNLGKGQASKLAVQVHPLPAAAGPISGPTMVCQRQRGITYTVPAIAHATTYDWSTTVDATPHINGNTLTLDFGLRASEGIIRVKGKNDCGVGQETVLNIKLSSIPETPVITQKGNDLTSSSPIGNQWYDSNGPIEGAVNQTYIITKSDDYYVVVTIDGCVSDPSETLSVTLNGIVESRLSQINLYPNPVSGLLHIDLGDSPVPLRIGVINSLGQTLYRTTVMNDSEIDMNSFAPGIYLIRVETSNEIWVKKLIRE